MKKAPANSANILGDYFGFGLFTGDEKKNEVKYWPEEKYFLKDESIIS